jgi:hypothetical protein
MATLEEKLYAVLTAICPRVFPDFAPVDTPRPYVTFQQFGGEVIDFITQDVPALENAAMQVNVWADSRVEAKATILLVEAALIGSTTLQASPQAAAVSDFDADMERYCSRQDFSIWADR